eukprot:sb/3479171/
MRSSILAIRLQSGILSIYMMMVAVSGKTLKYGCLSLLTIRSFGRAQTKIWFWRARRVRAISLLTIRSFGARNGLGLSVRVWLGFGLGVRLGLSIL